MTGADTAVHRALAKDSRVRLLWVLTGSDAPRSAAELAEEVGLHLTTVRAHLDILIEAGLVAAEREGRGTPGRPRLLYRATGAQPSAADGGYRLLAEVLASHLAGTTDDPETQAVAAGRVWGAYLVDRPPPYARPSRHAARAALLELLERLGFDPELDDDARILLRRCPFLEVARQHPDVVCSVHLGLLHGALEALDSPSLRAGALEPFVEPTLCIAHLETVP